MPSRPGDSLTISRVEGRQLLAQGGVSHLLQRTAAQLCERCDQKLLAARSTYAERRTALIEALAGYEITAYGSSGLGVWVPLAEETAAQPCSYCSSAAGPVSPGERYRFNAPPAIRITTTDLEPSEAKQLAAAVPRDRAWHHSYLCGIVSALLPSRRYPRPGLAFLVTRVVRL